MKNDYNDIPVNSLKEDKFEVLEYVTAIAEYISDSKSPLAISMSGFLIKSFMPQWMIIQMMRSYGFLIH